MQMQKAISKLLIAVKSKANLQPDGSSTNLPSDTPENYTKSGAVLMAYLGFKQPNKRRLAHLIPKDRAAWLELLCSLVLKKTSIQYLSDKELKKVIIRARPNLGGPRIPYKRDLDAPVCIDWTVEQVLEWLKESGFPHLIETFQANQITGRRLISVDCSALNQMGLRNLEEMRAVTAAIRAILDIPQPNALRALMRIPPYEAYLRKRIRTGRTYDFLTFAKYCKEQGFNYGFLRSNKNGLIPCTCEVRVVPAGVTDEEDDEGEESDEGERSLQNAPSVEFTVRNLILRDQTVAALIEAIMASVFCEDPEQRQYGKPIAKAFEDELYNATGGMTLEERLAFTAEVIESLMVELQRTAEVLQDIDELKKHIKEDVTPERVQELRECANIMLEAAMPIAGLVALGDLTLESIFRSDPELEQLVQEVVAEAEDATNALVPDAIEFVDSVLRLAMERLDSMDIPYLTKSEMGVAKSMVKDTLNGFGEYEFDDDTGTGVQTEKHTMAQDDKALVEFFRSGMFPLSPIPDTTEDEGEDEQKPKTSVGGEGHDVQTVGVVHTHGKPRGTLTIHSSDASTIPRSVTPPWSGSQRPDSGKTTDADEGGDTAYSLKESAGTGGMSLKEAGQLADTAAAQHPGHGPGKMYAQAFEGQMHHHPIPHEPPPHQPHSDHHSSGVPQKSNQSHLPQQPTNQQHLIPGGQSAPHQHSNVQDSRSPQEQHLAPKSPTGTPGQIQASPTASHPSPHLPSTGENVGSSRQPEPPTSVSPMAPSPVSAGQQGSQPAPPRQQQQPGGSQPQPPPASGTHKDPQTIPPKEVLQEHQEKSPMPSSRKNQSLAGVAPHPHPGLRPDPSISDMTKLLSSHNLPNKSPSTLQVPTTPSLLQVGKTPSSHKLQKVPSTHKLQKAPSSQKLQQKAPSSHNLPAGRTPSSTKITKTPGDDDTAAYGEKAYKLLTASRSHPTEVEKSLREKEKDRLADRTADVADKAKDDEEQAKVDIRKKIWDDLQRQKGGATQAINMADDDATEKSLVAAGGKKLWKGGVVAMAAKHFGNPKEKSPSFGLATKGPKRDLQQVRNVLVKRRQIVEEWAKENESSNMSENEEARLLRITADGVVNDILHLALTNMLLQAEAGKDTKRIMAALQRIKAPVDDPEDHDVLLWEPHLPGPGGPKKGGLRKEATSSKKKVQLQEDKPSEGHLDAAMALMKTKFASTMKQTSKYDEKDEDEGGDDKDKEITRL